MTRGIPSPRSNSVILGKLLSHKQEEALERARNEFYLSMRTSAQLLQTACRRALDGMVADALAVKKLA